MTVTCDHNPVWEQLGAGNNERTMAPPRAVRWCGTCGALWIRGEWRLPEAMEALAEDEETPFREFLTKYDTTAFVAVDGEIRGLEVRRVPCAACDYSGATEPASGEEPPIVRGALDAQAEAENRSGELRTMLLRVCNFFVDGEEAVRASFAEEPAVQAIITEARRVAR